MTSHGGRRRRRPTRQNKARGRTPLGTGFLAAALAVAAPATAAPPCWSPAERVAVAVRVLQSELTLGALVCGHRDVYSDFVSRQSEDLKAHGAALIGYFDRAYGGREGQRKLDALATRLANEASSRKTEWTADYCAFLRALTERAAGLAPGKLGLFAAAQPHARKTATQDACLAAK